MGYPAKQMLTKCVSAKPARLLHFETFASLQEGIRWSLRYVPAVSWFALGLIA